MKRPLAIALVLAGLATPVFAAVDVGGAWVRAAPAGAPSAAAYLTLTNRGRTPDRLLGATTPAARSVGVHSMSMAGGVMRMRDLTDGLELPPNVPVRPQPGGDHLMLTKLHGPLVDGARASITLRFAHSPPLRLTLPVRNAPPP